MKFEDCFFPKWFLRFLAEQGAEASYRNNFESLPQLPPFNSNDPTTWIDCAFSWTSTDNPGYWLHIQALYKKFLIDRNERYGKFCEEHPVEIDFLHKHNALNTYIKFFDPDRPDWTDPGVFDMLTWADTPEGFKYWEQLNKIYWELFDKEKEINTSCTENSATKSENKDNPLITITTISTTKIIL